MPLASRLVHRLAIVTPTVSGDVDDWNQPVAGEPSGTVLDGFLYPLSADEQRQVNEAGALVSTHQAVFSLRAIPMGGYVRRQPDDGERFDITGHQAYDFGSDPLVTVQLRRVEVGEPVEAAS